MAPAAQSSNAKRSGDHAHREGTVGAFRVGKTMHTGRGDHAHRVGTNRSCNRSTTYYWRSHGPSGLALSVLVAALLLDLPTFTTTTTTDPKGVGYP